MGAGAAPMSDLDHTLAHMTTSTMLLGAFLIASGIVAGWVLWGRKAVSAQLELEQAKAELAQSRAVAAGAQALARERSGAGDTTAALVSLRTQIDTAMRSLDLRVAATAESGAALRESLDQLARAQANLGTDMGKLTTILHRGDYRGRWGEAQLRRIVEAAGMLARVHFTEQAVAPGADSRLRPDLLVHLPENRQIVVDAKVPLDAVLESAGDAGPDRLAVAVKRHISSLGAKQYWDQFERSTDFVVMFLPAESLLSMALGADPGLLDYAFDRRVVPATPTTLLALLRSVSLGWRDVQLAQTAAEVQRIGTQLYERVRIFAEHLGKVGAGLDAAASAYNKAVGSFESRVLVAGRRMSELGIEGDPLPVVAEAEVRPRQVEVDVR